VSFLAGLLSLQDLSAQTDSLYLDEAVLVSRKNVSLVGTSGNTVKLDSRLLKMTPAVLGSSDPVRMARFLPSMQASTEIDAGIHIQGNDHYHNLVSSGGVPIYGATHLFGLFSVFNPSHFSTLDYATSAPEVNRLGGKLDIALPEEPARKAGGEVSLGLLAFQGSATIPTDAQGKSSVTASLRRSYLNLLYGSFLRFSSAALRYGFTDANLTWIWRPSPGDRVWVDGYYGNDAAAYRADDGTIDIDLRWRNAMAAVHHEHTMDGGGVFRQKAYVTHFGLSPDVRYATISFQIPSRITSAGYDGRWEAGPWSAGGAFVAHAADPQQLLAGGTFFGDTKQPAREHGQETTVFGRYRNGFGRWDADVSLKAILWHGPDGKWIPEAAPEVAVGYDLKKGGRIEARAAVRYQHLIQTGLTGIGLPFEFWMLAGAVSGPQRSLGVSLQHQVSFAGDAFALSSELYYRVLDNQVEYSDGILDLVTSTYDLGTAIRCGKGRAFGAHVMLHRKAGPVTGWLALSWGRSLRTFDPLEGECPARHERIFEADLAANYPVGRWTFSLTSLVAGGTPYTPANAIYILSNYLMVEYGPHNSARLPWYHRTDVGVNYQFRKGRSPLTHTVNFSLYNIFCADNAIYRTLVVNNSSFRYSFESIGIRLMPSIGYLCQF